MAAPTYKVSKIAIVNPYLLRGLTESSEMEAIQRFIVAAKNLGIEAAVFSQSNDVYDFNPDFVIPISHQEPKLTPYPTYGLFNNPIQWLTSSARFARNNFTYDGYMGVVPNAIEWLKQVCAATNKTLHFAEAVFTVPKTDFVPIDFSKASAAYLGVNWDGLRHFDLFNHFKDGKILKCYGPKESWAKYPADLYGGMIPFDGFTALKTYAEHGIGLCINHPAMDNEGFPTCRTFEIPASSAIAICSKNAYTQLKFKDTVLYVDQTLETKALAEAIKEKINWVRQHPKEAQEMARAAHDIFNKELSLEHFIQNIVNMHYEVIKKNGFVATENGLKTSGATNQPPARVTYIVNARNGEYLGRAIESIKSQTYSNINTVILFDSKTISEDKIKPHLNASIAAIHYDGPHCNEQVYRHLLESRTLWLGFINEDDILFRNHAHMLLKSYDNSLHDKAKESLALLVGNSLDHADKEEIKDKIQDYHMLYLANKTRVGNITPCNEIPLCAVLFKISETMLTAFSASNFINGMKLDISTSQEPLEVFIHSNEITCSSAVSENPSLVIIHNANSPLNFPNNYKEVEGKLLVDERQKQKQALNESQPQQQNVNQPMAAKQPEIKKENVAVVNKPSSTAGKDYQGTLDRVFYKPVQPEPSSTAHAYSVAIILRTKDRPICIPRAMKSIMSQTFKDWQLVIVNDGGNVEILESLLQPLKPTLGDRLKVIHHASSLGMSRGLIVGIDATDSEFIVVHDDDDSWQPEFLAETVNFMRDTQNADCCGVITYAARVREEINNNQIVEQQRDDFNSNMNPFTRISMYRILMQNTFPPISFLFKRRIIDKVGYFNEDLPVLNDWDFNIRCLFHEEIGVLPKHLANYHMRLNQQDTIYGNSIIATSNLCLQLETVIRNRSLRSMLKTDNHAALLGLCLAMGGEDLANTRTPLKLDITLNTLQQIPNWLQQVQAPIKNDLQAVFREISQLNNKLESLMRQKSGEGAAV